jgi:hypothetical protein
MDLVARTVVIASLLLVGAIFGACRSDRSIDAAVHLPSSGVAYRALDEAHRTAVAEGCRDRAASRSRGLAARQLRHVDADALRDQLDNAYFVVAEQRRPVADVCAEVIAFVTPGLTVTFDRATDQGDGTFSVETTSGRRLTISGQIHPAPANGHAVIRREIGPSTPERAVVRPDGRFASSPLRLRKIADNTFVVTIHAPPNAPRKVLFSAICTDCLASRAPPPAPR